MAIYSIPPQIESGLISLTKLPESDIQNLTQILNSADPGDGIREIVTKFCEQSKVTEELAYKIIRAIFSIVNIYYDSGATIEQFVSDFFKSYQTAFGSFNGDDEAFKKTITKLLPSFTIIRQTLKARQILLENPNNFRGARIVSDIRIVYDDHDELKKINQFAVIVHNLKIKHFNDSNPDMESHFSLDIHDLKAVRRIIDRAIEKHELLKSNHHKLSFIEFNY